jgi:hypothetical protein
MQKIQRLLVPYDCHIFVGNSVFSALAPRSEGF